MSVELIISYPFYLNMRFRYSYTCKNRLIGTDLMSTHNLFYDREIKKSNLETLFAIKHTYTMSHF